MIKRQEVYDLYWYFAYERQNIFLKKLRGLEAPWTEDEILRNYKFCNSYRVNDRVSQYLLKNVIYNSKSYSKEDMMFRIVLFKIFNKESTWELFINFFGDVVLSNFKMEDYSKILENALENGEKIYNKIFACNNMKDAFDIIKSYPLIGNFMAYQLVTDINYSDIVDWREDSFTVAGPGSLRGIDKCFIDKGDMSYEDIIRYMYDNQEKEFKRLGFDFKRIGDRPLQLIDCQNIFCELDKYCRERFPRLKSNRFKIKKKYKPKLEKIEYVYPPKWGIN